MEKQKRWQLYLILTVIVLTLYNILPTIFYYTKPLKDPINASRADNIALSIIDRVDSLENDSKAWLGSFCKLLGIKPASISLKPEDPSLFQITFQNSKDAETFKRFLPKAGSLIPFVPAQLELYPNSSVNDAYTVLVSRLIDVHLNADEIQKLFHFSMKEENGQITNDYRNLVYDRITQLALGFGGTSVNAARLAATVENPKDARYDDMVITLSKEMMDVENSLGYDNPLAQRYYASFTQANQKDAGAVISKFLARAETLKTALTQKRDAILLAQKKLKDAGSLEDANQQQLATVLDSQISALTNASAFMRKNSAQFQAGVKPLNEETIRASLVESAKKMDPKDQLQVLNLENRNPFIKALVIDWNNDKVYAQLYPEVDAIRNGTATTEEAVYRKEQLNQYLINEIARVSQAADESFTPDGNTFAIGLNNITNTQSFLTFDLGYLAEKRSNQTLNHILNGWNPQQADLARTSFPVLSYDQYKALSPEDQKLGLVVYAPAMYATTPIEGFRTGSIYVIARGLDSIIQKYRQTPDAPESQAMGEEVGQLNAILQQSGFIGYSGSAYGLPTEFRKDYIYELDDYYSDLLKATREDFVVKGSKRAATLDFTDVEQRILTSNKIADRIQEDLLKWKEEYNAAQVDLNATTKYQVPAPTKNVYWQNFKISFVKYFKGDDRKILKWGLDLSGGKTVRIGLRDHNNQPVTNPDDLNQAVNELYTRINNMGVSERSIHIENNNIILDFPGSQGLSASDLIKASAMYFHIVNEKFSPRNPTLREATQQFLQNVWNEAVVTNRKDVESINAIAWQHLGGSDTEQSLRPRSEQASLLFNSGLRLAPPNGLSEGHAFNDTVSSIALMRGEDFTEWDGQSNPLVVIFHNFALEGSSLTNVQVGYDPSQGNILSFGIKKSYEGSDAGTGSPRDDFYAWTSQFSEDKIVGTPKESYSQGHGWEMAVILNGKIISKPSLKAALKDGATISGRFSQREINQLAADLKAGSLSFTPQILSEQNVSPELGEEERTRGVVASLTALILVVVAMTAYYRFAGLVASCAVLFNILVMWGVLQNLDAALTLPGIAGIVLTIGMAVDANVLVFERIREEFKISGRIASAIQAGYRKAFSAIVDSNITTIIAAIILIQFDSGPIKGFAVTLIIGIISSMFTALFMTRYFFAGWVQNPKNKTLNMSQFIGNTNFDFLKQARKAIIISVIVMVIGTYFFVVQRKTLFGMDFTGGYSLNVELVEKPDSPSYRVEAADALLAHGATSNDFQIRELSKPNQLRIQLGIGMEEKDHPFYQMPVAEKESTFTYAYQKNPRIEWVVNALASGHLQVKPSQLENLNANWTVISGQFSDAMRNNALAALVIALFSILVYITFRFEFKYAIAAVIGLAHDVVITLGLLAILHKMGFAVQIDLQVVGAIMTIIGYSLNDTIIVFDRIREDLHVLRKLKFNEIINHALNVTLSRTLMTSGTTLLVLFTLVLLGGKSIFAFSLVMTIGVLVGTASSLFIATPVLLYFHNREEKEQERKGLLRRT